MKFLPAPVAKEDRRQFHYLVFWSNKAGPLILQFNWSEDTLARVLTLKYEQIAWHMVPVRPWVLARLGPDPWPTSINLVLYSTANDPQPQMIPRPQMIPKMDRKWSSTASDPESRPQMIPWKLEEWNGFYGTDDKKGLIIKKETFFSRLLNKDGRRPGRYISGQFIQGEKKNGINLKRYHGINRKLLPLSIASIFFQECFVFWKI